MSDAKFVSAVPFIREDFQKALDELRRNSALAKEQKEREMGIGVSAMLQMGQDFNRPETLLIGKRDELADRVKQQQAVADLVSAQNRLFLRILKLSPDMRQQYFAAVRKAGIFDQLAEIEKLDQQVIVAHPDPEKRGDALAGAEKLHRDLRSGRALVHDQEDPEKLRKLCGTYQDAVDRHMASRENMRHFEVTTEEAYKAIAAANGNKTAAAKLLGVSRAKVRRLTGEKM